MLKNVISLVWNQPLIGIVKNVISLIRNQPLIGIVKNVVSLIRNQPLIGIVKNVISLIQNQPLIGIVKKCHFISLKSTFNWNCKKCHFINSQWVEILKRRKKQNYSLWFETGKYSVPWRVCYGAWGETPYMPKFQYWYAKNIFIMAQISILIC